MPAHQLSQHGQKNSPGAQSPTWNTFLAACETQPESYRDRVCRIPLRGETETRFGRVWHATPPQTRPQVIGPGAPHAKLHRLSSRGLPQPRRAGSSSMHSFKVVAGTGGDDDENGGNLVLAHYHHRSSSRPPSNIPEHRPSLHESPARDNAKDSSGAASLPHSIETTMEFRAHFTCPRHRSSH
jgi:hypothetical protein